MSKAKTFLRRWWPGLVILVSALLAAVCFFRLRATVSALDSQQAAVRWQGESEQRFAQISCFLPPDEPLHFEEIYDLRAKLYQDLEAASLDPVNDHGLYHDAWSSFGTVRVSNGQRGGEVSAAIVGGDFFAFHPLRLLSGSYLSPDDVMEDRVLLDRETAWMLFGGVELEGMEFEIEGRHFVVAGVYEHETDPFTRMADEGQRIYLHQDAWRRLFPENDGILCYELLMADPVKGFALNSVTTHFPVKTAEIVENSARFQTERLFQLLRGRAQRVMRQSGAFYPYWENAARAAEDRASSQLLGAALFTLLPTLLLIALAIPHFRRGRRKLKEELLPDLGERLTEAARVRARKRWERRHPDMR